MFIHSQTPTPHVHFSGVGALQRQQLEELFRGLQPHKVRRCILTFVCLR